MIFLIYVLDKIVGADMLLLAGLICMSLYLAICFAIKNNRGKKEIAAVMVGLVIVELLCDLAWYLILFPHGEYHNYGIGAISCMFLLPILLFVSGVIVTVINAKRYKDR